jgi:L-aspartate oxidase
MFPRYIIDPKDADKIHGHCNCIIVGSGIAGLSTAIRVSEHTEVKVITKSKLSESTTWYAQGGIAAAIKKPDWWQEHYKDTITAGQGLSDSTAVEKLVKNAPRMIEDLIETGIKFDITGGEISMTLEGGHSFPRVLHAGGDATGEEIENKLVKHSKKLEGIKIFREYLAVDILTHRNSVLGVLTMNLKNGKIEIHPSDNIVLACGGIGQLYSLTTNPEISTGDGVAMAFRAGASIKDIEFIQFHPTVFKTRDKKLYLITEALRGEGAYLRDSKGKRFMLGKHKLAELAPRDIVVKEMVKVMADQDTEYVNLDATHIPKNLLRVRFPNIIAKLRENGLDLASDLIEVFPAAHYLNGGIRTDLKGYTDIRGLFACGETSATGAHGANRLASNSLIEGLVFGWEISSEIVKRLKRSRSSQKEERILKNIKKIIKDHESYRTGNKNYLTSRKLNKLIMEFRKMMTKSVGILRDRESLENAIKFIEQSSADRKIYNTRALKAIEYANMLAAANLIVKAANIRTESRGTHQRNDYPETDDRNWKKHIILKGEDYSFESVK